MLSSFLVLLSTLAVAHAGAIAPASAAGVGDITLLYHNEVDRSTDASHLSMLLLTRQSSNRNAQAACSSLSETLLSTSATGFTADIAHLLGYQVFQGHFTRGQLFWIRSNGRLCRAVNTLGIVQTVPCELSLPALCSQSAPVEAAPVSTNEITVKSNGLTLTGFRDLKTFKFLGIPYADAPARWTYPSTYTGPRTINATKFGAACVQTGATGTSEDCLFLNIWTSFIPQSASPKKVSLKPVMLWIHGGAFTGGSGSDSTFEGSNMASRGDVVLVTTNYRLSTLGFLALDDGKTKGNFGIADLIAALDWVRAHIATFGGDPERITVFGQSAGAGAVRALMGSPKAIGKFAAAIPMSNLAGSGYASTYSLYYTIPQEVELVAQPIMQATGCTGPDALDCLKKVDGQTLVDLSTVARFVVVDGKFVTANGLQLTKSSKVANVHIMAGFMRDDGAAFISAPTTGNLSIALPAAGLPASMVNNSLFIPPQEANPLEVAFNVTSRGITDSYFRCLDQATAFSGVQHKLFKSSWLYEFDRSYQTPGFDPNAPHCDAPVDATHPNGNPDEEYYKCHSGELFYVFGTLPANLPYRDAHDLPFMKMSLDTWTSFARTFDPNPNLDFLRARGFSDVASLFAAQPKWEPVTASNLHKLPLRQLQWGSFMTNFKEDSQCSFLQFPINYYETHPATA